MFLLVVLLSLVLHPCLVLLLRPSQMHPAVPVVVSSHVGVNVPVCRPAVNVLIPSISSNVTTVPVCRSTTVPASSSSSSISKKSSSSTPRLSKFTREEDIKLCREAMTEELFSTTKGTPARGDIYEKLSVKMTTITGRPLKKRNIRERLSELMTEFKKDQNGQIRGSGMNDPVPAELEVLLQDMCDLEKDAEVFCLCISRKKDDDGKTLSQFVFHRISTLQPCPPSSTALKKGNT
eukprot:TCONS_00072718-protein